MIILVDFSDVLADVVGAALDRICETHQTRFQRRQWKRWNPTFAGGIDGHEAAHFVTHDPVAFSALRPIRYASSSIDALCQLGHDVVVATGLPMSMNVLLADWLARHRIRTQGIQHFETWQDKANYPAHILVDDRPEIVAEFSGLGILFNQPWNQRRPKAACFTIDAPLGQTEVDRVLTDGGIIRAIGWKHVLRIVQRMMTLQKGKSEV